MNRYQIENLYQANGLTDYRLQNLSDLFKCHGIDYTAVQGYNTLDDIHRAMYETFLVTFMNAQGMDSRIEIVPTAINYVEDNEYLAKDPDEPEYVVTVKQEIHSINKNGMKKIIHSEISEKYKTLEISKQKTSNYLRIEYTHHGRKEWLHIIDNGEQWY